MSASKKPKSKIDLIFLWPPERDKHIFVYSLDSLAAISERSKRTILRWIKNGQIEVLKKLARGRYQLKMSGMLKAMEIIHDSSERVKRRLAEENR